jgi:thioredoxin-like negative regulator of GroEL
VTCLTLAAILQLPLLVPTESYAEAHRQTLQTGQPMVVMVGAEWCPACKAMEANVLPEMRSRGLLRRVAFALVDLDRDGEIGRKLTAGGPIPQLIVFRKTANGWKNRRLIGNQPIETVEEFISEDVQASEAEHAAVKKTAPDKGKARTKTQVTTAKDKSPSPPVRPVSDRDSSNN